MTATQWQAIAAKLRSDPVRRAQVLSLLRGILRECTYLPDAPARQYMKRHILERYRAYQPDNPALQPLLDSQKDRITTVTRKARKAFVFLRKANDGHQPQLTKVLFMTYGRIGRRRHELLGSIMKQTASSSTDKLSYIHTKLLARFETLKPETVAAIPRISPALEALLKSQVDFRPPGSPLSTPKTLGIDIPKLNVWYRRMPEKRIKNKVKLWFKDVLARTLPPLPQHEWHYLMNLAHGMTKWEGSVERRPLQSVAVSSAEGKSISNNVLLQQLRITNPSPIYAVSAQLHKPPNRFLKFTRPHEITSRMMRHIYQKVFQISPLMVRDDVTNTHQIKWGSAEPDATSEIVRRRRQYNSNMLAILESA